MSPTTERSSQHRLPSADEERTRGQRIATGLAALIGTVLIVVGVPIALLAGFGTPWPDEAPSSDWLSAPATGETILAILAVVVWLAWAHFVVCLIVEAVAERRKSGLAPHIPGGSIGTQGLARRLVASIVLLAAVTGVGMSSATAATAPDRVAPVANTTSQVATVDEVVMPTELPDGKLPKVNDLESATKLDVREGVTTYYDVKPPNGRHYDTLWDISERYLGEGRRYNEIWDLNKGVTQPDGRILEKADLIHPGWVLKLPNDAVGAGLKVVDHAVLDEVPSPAGGSGAAGPDAKVTTDAVAGEATAAQAGGSGININEEWAPFFGVAGGLALAGAFLGLRRRRASAPSTAWWTSRDPSNPDPHDPTPQPPKPGSALRDEADVSTASWLDRAIRSLNGAVGLPTPARVSLSEGGLAMSFTEEPTVAAPQGWKAYGQVWTLEREADVQGAGLSSLPGLVSIGRRDDGTIMLLDPESTAGIVALDGDSDVARGLALSMAVDTATHAWADRRVVTLVGFADDLTRVGNGALLHTDDVGRVLESLDNIARYQRAACREAGVASARAGRSAQPDAIDWSYHLVVCSGAPSAEELAQLAALAADPAVALGVVVVGATPSPAVRLTARPDGRVSSPLEGIDVTAQRLTVDAARGLAALYEPAASSRRVSMDQLVDVLEGEQQVSAAHEAVVQLKVLGAVEIEAPGPVDVDRRELLSELACFLAVHPGGVHANRISAAIWPRGVDAALRTSALEQLGAWFGVTSDGSPVVVNSAGIWQFAPGAVDLDWSSFRSALNRASEDGARRETHLRAALDLVRGEAFADVPVARYGWLEQLTLPGDIAIAVNLTVQAVAESAASRDDEAAASAALSQGLRMLPASEELWRSRLRLAAHFGDRSDIETVAGQMYAAIAEHGAFGGATGETDALVDELAPGYRSRVA